MALSLDVKDLKPILDGVKGVLTPPPAAPPAPMTPPPPQATPAVAGFSEWSGDPMNQEKVKNGITPPGQSIIPPNAQAALTPPPGIAAPGDWTATPPASAAPPAALTPPPSPAVTPKVTPPPSVDPALTSRVDADTAQLDSLRGGSGASQIKNKPGRIAAEIGDVAASVLAPRLAAAIPGTTAHNYMLQDRAAGRLEQDQNALKDANDIAYKQEQTRLLPVQADIKQQGQDLKEKQAADALAHNYAKLGFKQAPDGSWAEDPDSPITKQRGQKDELLSAQVEAAKASTELRKATAALKSAGNDPNSPAYQLALKKVGVAQQNANAASLRAKGYWGNYLKGAYNTDMNGQALPGAPIIEDEGGNQTVVGATNASSATKAQANSAQFNDVHGALDSIEKTADDLVKSGGRLNSPGVVAALSRPKSDIGKWLQGEGVKANLTPQERAYVQSIAAGHENIQALRKSAGGTATDSSVEKLDALIPDASTPDINYLKGQTTQIRQTAERLGKGATTATGGLKVRGQGKGSITAPPQSGPKAGDVVDGYRFKGGNPADQKNWEKK